MRALAKLLIGIIGVCFLAAFLVFPAVARPQEQPPAPPQEPVQYFEETGFRVRGPFLEYYNSRGGARVFGYPRSRLYYDTRLGLWVQYFDNVRMEWHPENADPYKVQLGLLGEELGMRMPPIPSSQIPRGHPLRRYFPETGHTVSFAFLTFFNENGGLDNFGYPITEPLLENGLLVQYFQRARLEWHPERPSSDWVVVGALGVQFLSRVPSQYLEVEPKPAGPGSSPNVERISVHVRNTITGRTGEQVVFVYLTNSERRPVADVRATVEVYFPSGTVTYTTEPSDQRGIARLAFSFNSLPVGRKILINVMVRLSNGEALRAETFFVPWY